jgi:serine/threonine-protein kinase TTK/MPS1
MLPTASDEMHQATSNKDPADHAAMESIPSTSRRSPSHDLRSQLPSSSTDDSGAISKDDQPFRPFQRRLDQENQRDYPNEESAYRLLRRDVDAKSALRHNEDRQLQPLGPTHVVARPSEYHQPWNTPPVASQLKPTRPAPELATRSTIQTVQAQNADPLAPIAAPELAQQAATLSTVAQQSVAPQTKRSFMVNGSPYERLGVLGKGGSSKVYSVLCPVKRVVYALKRVALERADAETYQSYTNEIQLLTRLRGHDRIIQLIDHQIVFGSNNRPKLLNMVSQGMVM